MKTFEEMGLDGEINRAIEDLGFEKPTPIQSKAISHLLSTDRDLIALAQTGTGKTAAFGLPLIQQIDLNSKKTRSLILCPTRELCMQITKDLQSYSKYLTGLRILAVYGGAKIETQIQSLKRGAQIVVGTPGRTLDLIKRKKLVVNNIRWVVLDEADEMLSMGFKDDLDAILEGAPAEKQTMLFSATMPQGIKNITKRYMNNPSEITVGKMNKGAENVEHEYYMVQANDRYEALKRIADINPDIYGIVFCRTRRETKDIADRLIQDGYSADSLHGDLSQAQRDIVMNRFREKHLQLLVATDVAARGLDVTDLSHIINFRLPEEQEIYIHRSGRTGRAGKKGISISIVHSRASRKITELEKKVGKAFTRKPVPGGREVCEMRLFNVIDKLENVEVDEKQIKPFLDDVYEKIGDMSREDIIKKFVWLEFNRFLSYYKDASDLNVKPQKEKYEKGKKGGKGKKGRRDVDFARFYINVGLRHRLTAQQLMGIINERLKRRNVAIGKIDIMKKFSFFEVDAEYTNNILSSFEGAERDGEPLFIELVKSKGKESDRGPKRRNKKKNKKKKQRF